MKYNISKSTHPDMPNQVRGTKCVQFLLSKASKDMHQSIVSILFSLLESHASGAKFMRPDQNREEMCSMMGNLMADRRCRKGPTVMTGGSHLPRLPTARRGGAHEAGCTHPVPQHARGGDDRPCCDSNWKTAKCFTSREVRLIVDYLGEPWGSSGCRTACEIVWNRMESYWIVWLPRALVVPLSCDWKAHRKSLSQ